MTTDVTTHDPEFPFLVIRMSANGGVNIPVARFTNGDDAHEWAAGYSKAMVIDTTPKPRIPDDVDHIAWQDTDDFGYTVWRTAHRNHENNMWQYATPLLRADTVGDLLHSIGDAEIILLDVREES